ncbi:hypothetical protein E2C01_067954 [Portunus trituberculatus]|uniref:Uncharacterized protein n=1 Tax=Portunus trituberculatus TaxID=210409 RepID=A0A5B7HY73_PORTR|nr:hypothetical protein [Portunus trituberculatus]
MIREVRVATLWFMSSVTMDSQLVEANSALSSHQLTFSHSQMVCWASFLTCWVKTNFTEEVKTQLPGDESQFDFTIPAFTEYVGDSEGHRLLCPFRVIREYSTVIACISRSPLS